MWSKDFDGWNNLKRQLNVSEGQTYYKTRDVWWCSVGVNVGSEQDGHNKRYERPVLILRGFSTKLFWGVPISTKIKPNNAYYYPFMHAQREYSAMISQLRVFDSRRLVRKLYVMKTEHFQHIQIHIAREVLKEDTKTDSQ